LELALGVSSSPLTSFIAATSSKSATAAHNDLDAERSSMDDACFALEDVGIDLETKRRRIGRFIGMSGCESPVVDKHGIEKSKEKWISAQPIILPLETWQKT
jgi:hypothetical protein